MTKYTLSVHNDACGSSGVPVRQQCTAVTVEVCGRTYRLAEQMLRVGKGSRMREVRRLCDDGHQTSVVTIRNDLPIRSRQSLRREDLFEPGRAFV